jgi:hypothetical protein
LNDQLDTAHFLTVKYSIAFYGVLPCHSDGFTAAGYASEDMALPEAVMGHDKRIMGTVTFM